MDKRCPEPCHFDSAQCRPEPRRRVVEGFETAPGPGVKKSTLIQLAGWGQRSSSLRGLFLVGLTLGVFYLLLQRIDLTQVLSLLTRVPLTTWLLATALTLSFPVMSAARWHLILRSMNYNVPVLRCLLIIVGVWPLSAVSPSKTGDLLKAYSLRREISSVVVAGSVLTERALDLLILAGFALVGGLAFRNATNTLVAAIVFVGILAGMALAHLPFQLPIGPKFQAALGDLLRSLRVIGRDRGVLALILFLTVANWGASIVQTKLLLDGVGAHVPLTFTGAALPVAIFAGLLPATFGGMGTRDAAIVILFSAHASAPQALAVGLLYSFFGYWLLAVLGLPFMKRGLAY